MNSFTPLVISHLLAAIAGAFLPVSSRYRLGVVSILVINSYVSLKLVDMKTWWGLQYAEYVLGFLLNANYFLCLHRISPSEEANTVQILKYALLALFNSRRDIAAKYLPQFSRRNPNYTPSRPKFLLSRIWTLTWTMSIFILLQMYPLSLWSDDFESPKDQILRRILDVSPREWIILLYISIKCWLDSYCLLNAAHILASVIAVAYGDEPGNWRPLFGSIRDAYTVQRFFGVFWHKLMRRAFIEHARFFVHSILRIPRGSSVAWFMIMLVVFFISAMMHIVSLHISIHCGGPRLVAYYCGIALVIALENLVIKLYKRCWKGRRGRHGRLCTASDEESRYWRVMGYFWVIFFHVWTTPKVVYPVMRCPYI